MTTDVEITQEDLGGGRGRYVARFDPGLEAEMTFLDRAGVRVVDHTGVPPALEGKGVGAALVKRLVTDARAQGFRIEPRCSFVAVMFRRHPEWADLQAG